MSDLYKTWQAAPPDMPEDLQHYGVLGMRWGVRKAQEYTNRFDLARRNAAIDRIQNDQTISNDRKKQLTKLAKADYKSAKSQNKAGARYARSELKKQIKEGQHKDENKIVLRDKAVASLEKEFPGFSRYADRMDAVKAARTRRIVKQALLAPFGIIVIQRGDNDRRINSDMSRQIQTTEGFNQYITDLMNR